MKAVITGITGQDGAYLCRFLTEKGYDVVGIARRKQRHENLEYLGTSARMYYGDISEADFVSFVMGIERPDEVYNLAAQSHVGMSFKTPLQTMAANYSGLVNLINCVKVYRQKCKIYQAGSSEMFGDSDLKKQNEDTRFNPKSPYAISKVAAHFAGVNARAEGVWVSNGILFNHESPIRGEDFVTRKITIAKALGEKVSLGNVHSRRDWGYAADYVRGMWMMLQHERPDDFVLATGETYSVLDFIKEAGVEYCTAQENMRPNDLNYLCGDPSKAMAVLGWRPEVGFKGLVRMMVEEDKKRYANKK